MAGTLYGVRSCVLKKRISRGRKRTGKSIRDDGLKMGYDVPLNRRKISMRFSQVCGEARWEPLQGQRNLLSHFEESELEPEISFDFY